MYPRIVAARFVLALVSLCTTLALPGQSPRPAPDATPLDSAKAPQTTVTSERPSLFAFDRTVNLPSGDPRRITLPRVKAGTRIELQATATESGTSTALRNLRIEILRDDSTASTQRRRDQARAVQMRSMVVFDGPWDGPLRYQTPQDGRYMVVLRQRDTNGSPIALNIRVQLLPSRIATRVVEPFTLSKDTRIAVAIFSAGLLWTTLLLCGAPIIRAFRSRRRQEVPPWFA